MNYQTKEGNNINMKIINIPAYSYFSGDTKAYRTDLNLIEGSEFIERMKSTFNLDYILKKVYEYDGTPITHDAYKLVNDFLQAPLIPYLGIAYHSAYKSGYSPMTNTPVNNAISKALNCCGLKINYFLIPDAVPTPGSLITPTKITCLNTDELTKASVGFFSSSSKTYHNGYSTPSYFVNLSISNDYNITISGVIFPDGVFDEEGLAPVRQADCLLYSINFVYDIGGLGSAAGIKKIEVRMAKADYTSIYSDLSEVYSAFHTALSGMTEDEETDDPYNDDGTSSEGGGDGGGGGGWIDSIDGAQIPPLPNINVCDLGLITMYNPSEAQVKALSDFLWSGTFDLNTYKKLFGDPMEGIIGLAIVPVAPDIGGARNVKIGNIDSGIPMPFLSSNWTEIDCGWVDIEKFVGCFMDADPYTKISIYLPFIGIRSLSADDINGGSIHVVYHVDVLTGACACFIEHSSRGVLYTYNGSCITNVPLTAINFSGAIQNAVSAVISGIGTVAGMATGAAPLTAMGAAGLLNSAANTALNSKPQIQRSGNLGGSAGILSILQPYVIIERPDISMPSDMNKMIGNTSNITYTLGNISGFTMCEYVHVEGCTGTSEEVAEIEALLKEGVYL